MCARRLIKAVASMYMVNAGLITQQPIAACRLGDESIASDPILYRLMCQLSVHHARGGYFHTWAWLGGSAVMTPVFGILNLIGSLFYTPVQYD